MRLIDADKLRTKAVVDVDSGEPFIGLQELDEAPTVDAVEVVRCKDCKHTYDDGCGAIYCKKWDRWEMPEDFYCSYGERKDK